MSILKMTFVHTVVMLVGSGVISATWGDVLVPMVVVILIGL